ncbi:MAG: acetate--CoA ligase family protein [Acetobacteraceae bacterium]|nr:acetate--CoA ligase family protein [Acetobacteraceae bacterium]
MLGQADRHDVRDHCGGHALTGPADLETLFRPRRVALVGASADPARTAGLPLRFLRQCGFSGEIYPVNPRASGIGGLPCFPSVAALPETPDVALVLLSATRSIEAVRELAERGARYAIVLASGFGEAGAEGRRLQDALLAAAGPMRLLGPNTIGLVNVTDRVPLSASGALAGSPPVRGPVGVISQSGGILGALLSRLTAAGVGLSKLVSTSNEADLPVAREIVVTDAGTAVAAAETLGSPIVLKILTAAIIHKSDIGGVQTGLDAQTVGSALERMRARLHGAGQPEAGRFLVQEMVQGGLEMILGCRRDPLGTVLLLGMGGVAAELMGDTALRMVSPGRPLTLEQAHALMRELRLWKLLDGYRGCARRDTDALARAVVDFSRLLAHYGNLIAEAEINPLFVLPAGQGVKAADGVLLWAAAEEGRTPCNDGVF